MVVWVLIGNSNGMDIEADGCNAMMVVTLNIGEQSNKQPTFVVLHLHRLYYLPYLLSHL